jgi:hypothetical protein
VADFQNHAVVLWTSNVIFDPSYGRTFGEGTLVDSERQWEEVMVATMHYDYGPRNPQGLPAAQFSPAKNANTKELNFGYGAFIYQP